MQEAVSSERSTKEWQRSAWLAPVVLALLALAMRWQQLDDVARFDELYHVFAARGWLESGELRVAEGAYDRASLFTLLVAAALALLGDSLEVARLVSVLAGVALVVLVFLWTRAVAGAGAAWVAALLLCFWPDAIRLSQLARFYTLHGLAFWLGAIGTYRLFTRPAGGVELGLLAAGTLGAFALALHLQPVTLIGVLGIGTWIALARVLPWLTASLPAPRRWLIGGAAVALGGLAGLLVLQTTPGAALLAQYRATPLWMAELSAPVWFYHLELLQDFPTLWSLTGLAVLVGLASRPQPTAFCACVFAVAFVALSFAGPKGPRFAYHVLPFLFVLWGIALAGIWPRLWGFVEEAARRARAWLGLDWAGRWGTYAILGLVLAQAVLANGTSIKSAAELLGVDLLPDPARAWASVRPQLEPWLDATVVVTTSELPALYYLGRHDLLVSRSRLEELQVAEFGLDRRTGRPVISTARSLELVMDCYPDGLIVTSAGAWRDPADLDAATADLITTRATPLALEDDRMLAFAWQRPPDAPRPAACPPLPTVASDGSAAAD